MKSLRSLLLLLVLLATVGAWLYFVWIDRSYQKAADEPAYSSIEEGFYVGPYVRQPPPT